MKADAGPDRDDGAARDELRAMLRHWSAPAAPPEIEHELRRAFRRQRSRGRRAVWLSLAAGLTLLAAWQLRLSDRPSGAPSPPATVAVATPAPPAAVSAEPDRVSGSAVPAAESVRARRARGRWVREADLAVVVERDQAALLAELSRTVRETRQAAPGTAIPPMPEGDVPRYRDEWQTLAGQSSFVEEPGAIGGR